MEQAHDTALAHLQSHLRGLELVGEPSEILRLAIDTIESLRTKLDMRELQLRSRDRFRPVIEAGLRKAEWILEFDYDDGMLALALEQWFDAQPDFVRVVEDRDARIAELVAEARRASL